METYYIDEAMCGDLFGGSVERVCEILQRQGYNAAAITDSVNGAPTGQAGTRIDDQAFWDAVEAADAEAKPLCPWLTR